MKKSLNEYLATQEKNRDKCRLSWNESNDLLFKFCTEYGRVPTQKEKYEDVLIGSWFHNQKGKISSPSDEVYQKLSVNPIVKTSLDKYLGIIDIWEIKKDILFTFCVEFGRVPSNKDLYKGVLIGSWLYDQKKKVLSPLDEVYQKLSVNPIVKTSLDTYLTKKGLKL